MTLNTEQGLLWDMGSMKTAVTLSNHFYHRRRSLVAADVVQRSVLFIKSFYEVADVCEGSNMMNDLLFEPMTAESEL